MIHLTPTFWTFFLGFLGQSLFGARIMIQWLLTEKRKTVASPVLFWILSLGGAAIFLVYGVIRNDLAIVLGQLIGYYIYVRNLQLMGRWNRVNIIFRGIILLLPAFSLLFIPALSSKLYSFQDFLTLGDPIVILGVTGQLLFNGRFLYQLYYAEKKHESILPVGFWWVSLVGSVLTIVYAAFRRDPVLLTAQGLAVAPYIRNITIGKT